MQNIFLLRIGKKIIFKEFSIRVYNILNNEKKNDNRE